MTILGLHDERIEFFDLTAISWADEVFWGYAVNNAPAYIIFSIILGSFVAHFSF